MTSRERVRAAIAHKLCDKIPVDLGGMGSTGININSYDKLTEKLGLAYSKLARMNDIGQQLAFPYPDVLDRLGVDCVQADLIPSWHEVTLKTGIKVLAPPNYTPRLNADGSQDLIYDGKIMYHMPKESYYFDLVVFPFKDLSEETELDKIDFGGGDKVWAEYCINRLKKQRTETGRAILFGFGGNILEGGTVDFGFANFMELLLAEPSFVHKWARKKTDMYLKNLEVLLPEIARYADVIVFGDDLGTQESTLISKSTYKEMIHPYHKEIYQYTKKYAPELARFLHSCGAIEPLIPYIIDEGIQIINPVQFAAKGMDSKHLKKEYGKDIVLWGGGADMQHTVASGTIDDIKNEVRKQCEIFFSDRTGFVFSQVHNILGNVTPEKVLAIYDTVREINAGL